MIYFIIGLIIGVFIPAFLMAKVKDTPLVLEEKILDNPDLPTKIYTIINSDGEKETIMTSKNMHEVISELYTYANKQNDQEN